MSDADEFRCFIGGLAWSTSDRKLKDAFEKYGKLLEAKVVVDKFSRRSRGFGFVTFDDKEAMEEAIEAMNGSDLDGRTITVDKAQPQGSSRDDDDRHRERVIPISFTYDDQPPIRFPETQCSTLLQIIKDDLLMFQQ
ncbi:hypothetical protein TSUD_194220 [Trifolium subterraneum]|uniref:RRM domain-containing protein n=1 Tax=Trifolium subterraneum TaxID=3900 RepID=A0A2Z6NEK2_TRISU|nr:hypothetical protein TSUD_194220 [Trifolium subterraneum]